MGPTFALGVEVVYRIHSISDGDVVTPIFQNNSDSCISSLYVLYLPECTLTGSSILPTIEVD